MAQQNNIAQQLNDLLVTRNFHPDMLDAQGKVSDSEDAKTFTFDYISSSGKNYGTMVVILDSDNDVKAFYGDNLGRSMEGDDKNEFFDFQQHLSQFANARRYTYTAKDLGQLKHTMQGLAAIKEGLFEGYYGTRRISYAGEPTEARLMIRHNRNLGENDARFRYVESIFVETADGERYRLPFVNLAGGRAMLEHVRQGGKPYDVRGNHICEMITELKVLTRFNRASQGRVVEGITQGVVEGAQTYYKSLRESIKRLSSPRGYTAYFESWHPANITEQDQLVEDIKTLFIEQTIDDRIEQALPLLAKIQRGREMKEADIFENWINTLAKGTWSLPETPEQLTRLKTLMSGELIVGPDGTNATEQLYDLIGDDKLFDRISELAQQDPRANLWDDSMVQARMQELGIQMPDNSPSGAEDPSQPEQPPADQDMAEADNIAAFEGLQRMRHLSGMPLQENVLNDAGSTLDYIMTTYQRDIKDFVQNGDMSEYLYDALYDYYFDDMPYGVKKARTGDPYEWIGQRFYNDIQGVDMVDEADYGLGYQDNQLPFVDPRASYVMPANAAEREQDVKDFGHLTKNQNLGNPASPINKNVTPSTKTVPFGQNNRTTTNYVMPANAEERAADLKDYGPLTNKFNLGSNPAPAMEDKTFEDIIRLSGAPINENVLNDSGSTLDYIIKTYQRDVKDFVQNGDMSEHLFDALYDYYLDDMPYGVKKARSGDPYEWIGDRFSNDLQGVDMVDEDQPLSKLMRRMPAGGYQVAPKVITPSASQVAPLDLTGQQSMLPPDYIYKDKPIDILQPVVTSRDNPFSMLSPSLQAEITRDQQTQSQKDRIMRMAAQDLQTQDQRDRIVRLGQQESVGLEEGVPGPPGGKVSAMGTNIFKRGPKSTGAYDTEAGYFAFPEYRDATRSQADNDRAKRIRDWEKMTGQDDVSPEYNNQFRPTPPRTPTPRTSTAVTKPVPNAKITATDLPDEVDDQGRQYFQNYVIDTDGKKIPRIRVDGVGRTQDDPMDEAGRSLNYESREGDALLARIKSLALLR